MNISNFIGVKSAFFDGSLLSEAHNLLIDSSHQYPFGMLMDGRNGSAGEGYRYGFQGYEGDSEIKGQGNSYTTEFRQYDPRIGRWLTMDPLAFRAPGWTPYRAFYCNPIVYQDADGLFETRKEARQYKKDNNIEGIIRKDSDGGFNVSNKYTGREWHKGSDWERDHGYADENGIVNGSIAVAKTEGDKTSSNLYWWLSTGNSTLGTLAGGIGETVGGMKAGKQWELTKKYVAPTLKKLSLPNSTTNKAFNKVVKPVLKLSKTATKKIPGIGVVMTVGDMLIGEEVKPSHILDLTVAGVGTIPVFGWIVAGVYIVADGITYAATGKTIGDHLDEVDWSNLKTLDSFSLDHPVYQVMPTYSPGGQKN